MITYTDIKNLDDRITRIEIVLQQMLPKEDVKEEKPKKEEKLVKP